MQDVVAALKRKGLRFSGYLDPSRPARLDVEHAVRVNYETYLFADREARNAFRAEVRRYCGLLTDPVSHRRFRPGPDAPRLEHGGVLYLFPDHASRDAFEADPERYRLPRYTM